ncbi:hypothetical protein AB6A40_009964 [Gnathostoma spinigerum]|uniref:Uncharacterized protein n=1 Tax=Gnathostoma spinigerum TaxID=75299 RepID=A0ABD6ETF6_9BILA
MMVTLLFFVMLCGISTSASVDWESYSKSLHKLLEMFPGYRSSWYNEPYDTLRQVSMKERRSRLGDYNDIDGFLRSLDSLQKPRFGKK